MKLLRESGLNGRRGAFRPGLRSRAATAHGKDLLQETLLAAGSRSWQTLRSGDVNSRDSAALRGIVGARACWVAEDPSTRAARQAEWRGPWRRYAVWQCCSVGTDGWVSRLRTFV